MWLAFSLSHFPTISSVSLAQIQYIGLNCTLLCNSFPKLFSSRWDCTMRHFTFGCILVNFKLSHFHLNIYKYSYVDKSETSIKERPSTGEYESPTIFINSIKAWGGGNRSVQPRATDVWWCVQIGQAVGKGKPGNKETLMGIKWARTGKKKELQVVYHWGACRRDRKYENQHHWKW